MAWPLVAATVASAAIGAFTQSRAASKAEKAQLESTAQSIEQMEKDRQFQAALFYENAGDTLPARTGAYYALDELLGPMVPTDAPYAPGMPGPEGIGGFQQGAAGGGTRPANALAATNMAREGGAGPVNIEGRATPVGSAIGPQALSAGGPGGAMGPARTGGEGRFRTNYGTLNQKQIDSINREYRSAPSVGPYSKPVQVLGKIGGGGDSGPPPSAISPQQPRQGYTRAGGGAIDELMGMEPEGGGPYYTSPYDQSQDPYWQGPTDEEVNAIIQSPEVMAAMQAPEVQGALNAPSSGEAGQKALDLIRQGPGTIEEFQMSPYQQYLLDEAMKTMQAKYASEGRLQGSRSTRDMGELVAKAIGAEFFPQWQEERFYKPLGAYSGEAQRMFGESEGGQQFSQDEIERIFGQSLAGKRFEGDEASRVFTEGLAGKQFQRGEKQHALSNKYNRANFRAGQFQRRLGNQYGAKSFDIGEQTRKRGDSLGDIDLGFNKVNALMSMAGLGQTGVNQNLASRNALGTSSANTASNIAGMTLGAGDARAASAINKANAITGAGNSLVENLSTIEFLKRYGNNPSASTSAGALSTYTPAPAYGVRP